ncbi:O-antigen ligase family protein [Polaribacter sp. M15]
MKVISHTFTNVFQEIRNTNFTDVLLIIILITLPVGFAINSSAIILFFLGCLYSFVKNKYKFSLNKIEVLFILFYLVCFLSMFWSDNLKNTTQGLIRFLSYLILPLAFGFNKTFNVDKIIAVFSKTLVLYSCLLIVVAIYNVFINSDINFMFYHKLSSGLGYLNAIYLSIYTSIAIAFFIFKEQKTKYHFMYLFILMFFLLLLSSKLIIVVTLFFVFVYFMSKRKYKKFKLKSLFILPAILIVFILASKKLVNRVNIEFEKTKVQEILSKKDFGHVYLWTGSGLRIFQTKVFLETLDENKKLIFGLGLNNSQESLNRKYKEYNLYPGFLNYNYHNQYIQVFAELGVLGLFILISIFIVLLKKAINFKDYFLLYFIILILAVCVTESFLWRQRGMVFFIIMVLLFFNKTKRINHL